MRRCLIMAWIVLLLVPLISHAEEESDVYYRSWRNQSSGIQCIDGTLYVLADKHNYQTNIYVLNDQTLSLYLRRLNVYSLGVYDHQLVLKENHMDLLEKFLITGGTMYLCAVHPDRTIETLYKYSTYHEQGFVVGAAVRNNQVCCVTDKDGYELYTIDRDTGNRVLLYASGNEIDIDYDTFCLLEVIPGFWTGLKTLLDWMIPSEIPLFTYQSTYVLYDYASQSILRVPLKVRADSPLQGVLALLQDYATRSVLNISPLKIKQYTPSALDVLEGIAYEAVEIVLGYPLYAMETEPLEAVLIQSELYYLSPDGVHVYDLERQTDEVFLELPPSPYRRFTLSDREIAVISRDDPDSYRYSVDIYARPDGQQILHVQMTSYLSDIWITDSCIYWLETDGLVCIDRTDLTSVTIPVK